MTIRRQPADVVQFTRASAERIAEVVRQVEGTPLPGSPLRFSREIEQRNPRVFRIATFSGAWPVGSPKTVTFKYSTAGTAIVQNLFFPVAGDGGDCAIAKDGTAWFLIDVPLYTAAAVVMSSVAIHSVLNTVDCTITVSQTAGTTVLSYVRLEP